MTNSFRRYGIQLGLTIFKKALYLNIHPFYFNRPVFIHGSYNSFSSEHSFDLHLGIFHLWDFNSRDTLFAIEVQTTENMFWNEPLTIPPNAKRIF